MQLRFRSHRRSFAVKMSSNLSLPQSRLFVQLVLTGNTNERRSLKRLNASVAHLVAFFRDDRAVEVTSDRIANYVSYRRDEGAAAASINRELAALKRAFHLGEMV